MCGKLVRLCYHFQCYVFAYQFIFFNDSDKKRSCRIRIRTLVKFSSEMLQNCGNAYVKFNSPSFFLSYTLFLYIETAA